MTEYIYIDDYGSGFKPKQNFRNIYDSNYQQTYCNRSYVLPRDYIKYTRNSRNYSGRKIKATGFVYLKGLP